MDESGAAICGFLRVAARMDAAGAIQSARSPWQMTNDTPHRG